MTQDWSETGALMGRETPGERQGRMADLFMRHRARLRHGVHPRLDPDREQRLEPSCTQLPPVYRETAHAAARLASPGDAAMRKDEKKRAPGVLEAMEPLDREILVLRHMEGLTGAEAARDLGLREAAARQRYVRALLRFGRALTARKDSLGSGETREGR